jgi:hypothetical protein
MPPIFPEQLLLLPTLTPTATKLPTLHPGQPPHVNEPERLPKILKFDQTRKPSTIARI